MFIFFKKNILYGKLCVSYFTIYRDWHFRPLSVQCDVCGLGVDALGREETLEWEMMYIRSVV